MQNHKALQNLHFIKQPCNSMYQKVITKALNLPKRCCTLAKQRGKSNILVNSRLQNTQTSPEFHLPVCQPAVRSYVELWIFHTVCQLCQTYIYICCSVKDLSTV